MKYLIFLLFSFNVFAEFSLEFANNKTAMVWKGSSQATYNYNLKTVGATYFYKLEDGSEIGIRTAYGRGRATLPNPGAEHPNLIIELKSAVDLELIYRHTLYGDTMAYWGVGYYWDHLPIRSLINSYKKDDWDNGVGSFAGLEHRMTKHLAVFINYRIRNIIGPAKSHSGGLGSSHTSFGAGFKFTF